MAFYPTLEAEIPGEERFVTKFPKDSLHSDYVNNVSVVIGIVKDEGIVGLAGILCFSFILSKCIVKLGWEEVREFSPLESWKTFFFSLAIFSFI